jgi:hypothetical protein
MPIGQKVRLLVDHNNKPLKTPKYGYIVEILNGNNSANSFFTERGMILHGEVFLIQTRCLGGALWYTSDAFVSAKGKNHWNEWQRKAAEFHEANNT